VHLYHLHQPYELLLDCSSDVVRMSALQRPGAFLLEFADNSVRLVGGGRLGCHDRAQHRLVIPLGPALRGARLAPPPVRPWLDAGVPGLKIRAGCCLCRSTPRCPARTSRCW
jgi:hypothetical protein